MLWLYILAIIIGYLIGSISPSYILGRSVKGIDIRKYGIKNAGTSNAFRTMGPLAGIITLVFDLAKGALAILVAYLLFFGTKFGLANFAGTPFIMMCLAGFAAICGHNWPFYMQFKGGKGAATAGGIIILMLVLMMQKDALAGISWTTWIPFIIMVFFGVAILIIAKSANLTAFISYPIASALFLMLKPGVFSAAISLFLLYLVLACITTVVAKKGIGNDMKFAEKKKKDLRVWRKSLRFVFLIFPVIYLWLEKTPILIIFGILALIFLIFDLTKMKKSKVIRHLYKKSETEKAKISGITLFLIGAFIAVLFFQKNIAILAMIFATIGDNFAVLFGVKFGRHRLFKDKSIEGTVACLATNFLAGLVAMLFLNIPLLLVVVGALATAIAELFSGVYDNLTMAPFAGLVMNLIKHF
jgi:glycerol-3-phosphate acyltransferase PlsY